MAWTNVGYDGTVNEVADAQRSPHIGALTPVVVGAATSFQVTANAAADRTVTVAPGQASGFGLLATNDASTSVQLDTVSAGFRWDAIVLRRDWTTNTSSIVKVTNTALNVKTVPSTLQNTPGVMQDQLLALVQVTAGQTLAFVENARARASKIIRVDSLLHIPFPELGMVADVGLVRYVRTLDASGNPAWVKDPTTTGGSTITPLIGSNVLTASTATGWTAAAPSYRTALVNGNTVQVSFGLRKASGTLAANATNGNFPDPGVGTIVPALRPDDFVTFVFHYYAGPTFVSLGGIGELRPDGAIVLLSGAPGAEISPRPATGVDAGVSVVASITYVRKAG